MPTRRNIGFTLIELSIVMVIIGLIVGGVLVGQDLIVAARIRAQIAQIEEYNAAVNAFNVKYNAIPGDIPSLQASQIGLFARSNSPGDGDGDGYVASHFNYGTQANAWSFGGEDILFWADLAATGLIKGGFTVPCGSSQCNPAATTYPAIAGYIPPAKIGRNTFIVVYSQFGPNNFNLKNQNTYQIVSVNILANAVFTAPALTPIESHAIDVKIDDGSPLTGRVQSMRTDGPGIFDNYTTPSPSNTPCLQVGPPVIYGVSGSQGTSLVCSISIQGQF